MGASADDGTVGEESADTDAGAVSAAKPWAVYLLHSAGGRRYIGISPNIAQTLVQLSVDLTGVRTLRSLKEGLKECFRMLRDKTT